MGGGCCVGNCCVGKVFKDIKDFFFGSSSGSKSGGRTSSYDPQQAQLEETLRVQKALTEFRTDTQDRSTKFENSVIIESREYLDKFLKEVKKYNKISYAGRSLNINISNIERENRKTEDNIHGFVVKRVSKRISLDDSECLEILKLDAGSKKTKELNTFYHKVLTESVIELTSILRDSMEKQTDIIEERLQQRIDSILDTFEIKTLEFEKIQELKNNDENDIEKEQLRLSYLMAICDLGLSFIDK